MASISVRGGDEKASHDDEEDSIGSQNQNGDLQRPEPDCQAQPTLAPAAAESPVPVGDGSATTGSPVAAPEEALLTIVTTSPFAAKTVREQLVGGAPAAESDAPPPATDPAAPANSEPARVGLPEPAESDATPPATEPAAPADSEPARVELPEPAAAEKHVSDAAHHIKWVQFHSARSPVITQNVNGPCPLLALINVMLLKGKVQLPSALEVITIGQLMDYIGDTMLDSAPAQSQQPDFQQNMQDAVAIVPKLQTGLDVNVKFCGVQEFEYTPECCIFDLLNVRLYHGWLVEPDEPDVQRAVGQCGYNQLVDKIITNKSSDDPELSHQALLAENFLESTASQLTAHGLNQLRQTMRDGELAVFFRNNHFSTIYRYQDVLYLLVTDQGFLREPRVVWETLTSTDGAGQFVDGNFEPLSPERPAASSPQQVDQDYLVALSLQEESSRQRAQDVQWEEYKQAELGTSAEVLSDEELARRLQEEEERGVREEQQQQQQQQHHQRQQQQQRQQPAAAQRQLQRIDSSSRGSEGRRKNCTMM